ncbi:MAG TPA: quinone-dependent dihydroorotate dehydrogenase [Aggregatilineales bacterium]|nr:quinone-dependent dihydroorotate dehydrogenase [Aggregatilineales bacterium]
MYRFLYRHLLSRFDAEFAHDAIVHMLQVAERIPPVRLALQKALAPRPEGLSIRALGLDFAHPLGLASGFDKDATGLRGLNLMGFSFAEIGTVTPWPQPGNPRQRIFRLLEDEALINRMGFPSAGMQVVAGNLQTLRRGTRPIGVSLGKNKDTPLLDAHQDYSAVLKCLYPYGDFFVVNVSSPNTPELRRLQTRDYLAEILSCLQRVASELTPPGQNPRPLLVKIAPDLSWAEIDAVLELATTYRLGGIVATNTTTSRGGLSSARQAEAGGLSGRPLRQRSNEIIRHIYRQTEGNLTIIGVGGVFTGDDVWEKMTAGAALVQAYTGFIYEGPRFVQKAIARLRHTMREAGIHSLGEIVGTDSGRP